MKNVIQSNIDSRPVPVDGIVQYKFAMDGASVANDRNIKQVVAILEHISNKISVRQQRSPYHCLPLEISVCNETYEDLKTEFQDLFNELNEFYERV